MTVYTEIKLRLKAPLRELLSRGWHVGVLALFPAIIGTVVARYGLGIPNDQLSVAVAVPTLVMYVFLRIMRIIIASDNHAAEVSPSLQEIRSKDGATLRLVFGIAFVISLIIAMIGISSAAIFWAINAPLLLNKCLMIVRFIVGVAGLSAIVIVLSLMLRPWAKLCLGVTQSILDRMRAVPSHGLRHVISFLLH